MAWAEKLPNGNWRGFWRDASGTRRSRTQDNSGRKFTHEAAANRYANEQEAKARRGERSPDGRGLTWGEWCPRWLELRRVEPSTKRADAGRIEHHLMPRWGKVRLSRIEIDDIQAWVNDLDADPELSPSTVRRIHYLMSASMKAAVRSKHVTVNPCHDVSLPTPPPVKHRYLTWDEFFTAAYFMRPPYWQAATLLVGTGMRFGELAGLHWDAVDLDTRMITVRETWDASAKRIKPYPKGKHSRSVPIPAFAVDALLTRLPERPTEKCGLIHAKGSVCGSPLVLVSPTGLPLSYSTMAEQHWQPALKLAGIGHARNHDLRHTYAAWLRQNGVDLEGVQKLLGHGSIITTQIYSDLGDTHHGKVLEALGDK
jgi:integrase